MKKNKAGKEIEELFNVKNDNISCYSVVDNKEDELCIRLFNTKNCLQSTDIEFDFPIKKILKVKSYKNFSEEIEVVNKSVSIALRPKEVLTVLFSTNTNGMVL